MTRDKKSKDREQEPAKIDPVGGQAVMEGVLMRSKDYYCVVVRKKDGSIVVKKEPVESATKRAPWKWLFVRGIVVLYESLKLGIDALTFSANITLEGEGEKKLTKRSMALTMIPALIIAVAFFVGLPYLLSYLLGRWLTAVSESQLLFNIVDGILRIVLVVGYIWVISLSKEIRRVFAYHGAEHKTIAGGEEGAGQASLERSEKASRFHRRCGTSFIIIVLLVIILMHTIIFSIFPGLNRLQNIVIRILLIPFIAGITYEIIRLSARFPNNWLLRGFTAPGLWMQRVTTREPDEGMLEVALVSMSLCLDKRFERIEPPEGKKG